MWAKPSLGAHLLYFHKMLLKVRENGNESAHQGQAGRAADVSKDPLLIWFAG